MVLSHNQSVVQLDQLLTASKSGPITHSGPLAGPIDHIALSLNQSFPLVKDGPFNNRGSVLTDKYGKSKSNKFVHRSSNMTEADLKLVQQI